MPPSTFNGSLSTFSARKRGAFSLIEVVLAIGVVAFALLGIFGLFSSSLKNNRDSSAQQEGFEVPRMIISRLQDTNFLMPLSLGELQSGLCASGSSKNYYLYTASNSMLVLTNSPAGYTIGSGLLYFVQITLSPNVYSMTNVFPVAAGSPSSSDWVKWPGLPLQAKVYSIPSPSMTNVITNSAPVMIFDMVISR